MDAIQKTDEQLKLERTLQGAPAFDLLKALDDRYYWAHTYVFNAAMEQNLAKRREIVAHIEAAMKKAETTHNIPETAAELRAQLIHDFWREMKTPSIKSQQNKLLLEDFAVMAVANPGPHKEHIQETLNHIVFEDRIKSRPGTFQEMMDEALSFADYNYNAR